MGERRGIQKVLVGKPEGKNPVAISRRGGENNIKTDLQVGTDACPCECVNERSCFIKCGEFLN